jgi:ATP-binding cassette subfamily B protein
MSIPLFSEESVSLQLRESFKARFAVLLAGWLIKLPPRQIAKALHRLTDSRPIASVDQGTRAREAVCTVSPSCRGPQGCLRRSVSTVLFCRLSGRSATWCTGFTIDPFRAHAWVEIDSQIVGEHSEISDYVTVLSSKSDMISRGNND